MKQVITSVDRIIDRQNVTFSCPENEVVSTPWIEPCSLQYRMTPEEANLLTEVSEKLSLGLSETIDSETVVWNGLRFPIENNYYIDQLSEFLAEYTQKIRQEVGQKTLKLEEELARCQQQLVLSQQAEHQTRKQNLELKRISRLDGLTKIANRRHFDEQLQFEWRRLTRSRKPLSLVLCDVDYFKRYNDTYGHQMGDLCLKQVAQALRKSKRRTGDFVARYGGEEFVFLLPNTDESAAIEFAQTVKAAIDNLQLPHRDSAVSSRVTLSMGISSMIPAQATSPDTLFLSADKALYEAKNTGRDRIVAR